MHYQKIYTNLRKRLYLKNLSLQFFDSLNILYIPKRNTLFKLEYFHLTNNYRSSATGKFLISSEILLKGLNLTYKKDIVRVNDKYIYINYNLKSDIFKFLMFMGFKNLKQARLQYIFSETINDDLFNDSDFNKIDNIKFVKNSFILTSVFTEIKDLLKAEGFGDIYNLGEWKVIIKSNFKVDDLVYLVLFNL